MCENKEMFYFLDELVKSIIKFGNNTNILMLRKGKIIIRLKDDIHNFIFDMFVMFLVFITTY